MSRYWNNHPEEYEEIVRKGIRDWLGHQMHANGVSWDGINVTDEDIAVILDGVLESLLDVNAFQPWPDSPTYWRKLEWILSAEANSFICNREADYWSRFAP